MKERYGQTSGWPRCSADAVRAPATLRFTQGEVWGVVRVVGGAGGSGVQRNIMATPASGHGAQQGWHELPPHRGSHTVRCGRCEACRGALWPDQQVAEVLSRGSASSHHIEIHTW